MAKILVVEDDTTLLEMLKYNLMRQEYEVLTAQDGRTGLQLARKDNPDLIILDLMLPMMDGFEVCRILRKEMSVPLLMLTARTEEIDKIVGLEMGADDYITKPFSMRELLARVKAHLRRVELIREDIDAERNGQAPSQVKSVSTLTFGNLVIDENRREVRLDGKPLKLKPKEFELLEIHISILGIPEPVTFSSEQDLISQIRPDVDGLILTAGANRGTFLPSVWESLKTPQEFWAHLKLKAGLPVNFWSDNIKVERYTTESF